MAKKIGFITLTWVLVIFCYILLAILQTPIQQLTSVTETNLQATSNMTNYPGTLEFVQGFPVFVWFIPGGVAVAVTAVILKRPD